MRTRRAIFLLGLALSGIGIALILLNLPSGLTDGKGPDPPSGPFPLVPTAPPAVGTAAESPTPLPSFQGAAPLWRGRPRWGIGVTGGPLSRYDVEPLRLGWYLDWGTAAQPAGPATAEYAQMVRLWSGRPDPDPATIAAIARANPGSLWLVGNEPDVPWFANLEPETYARLYHESYATIKGADPTARVAIGGVSQPTPLRLAYLDRVLTAYREMYGSDLPADVWNAHNFILREERGSWGAGIPAGMDEETGRLYEIDDNDDLAIFAQQIWDLRIWMAERGYGHLPLIISEYGIPMPEDYGFPPQRVAAFLTGTFDFFLTAADPALGYPDDGGRLVQRWCWYSLADTGYPTGNLFDPQTGQMTPIGAAWAEYVREK